MASIALVLRLGRARQEFRTAFSRLSAELGEDDRSLVRPNHLPPLKHFPQAPPRPAILPSAVEDRPAQVDFDLEMSLVVGEAAATPCGAWLASTLHNSDPHGFAASRIRAATAVVAVANAP